MIVPDDAPAAPYQYVGAELDLFAKAVNWKRYFRSVLAPFITGDVLEVGAGIGETTRYLHDKRHRSWLCLEPDARLADRLRDTLEHTLPTPTPRVQVGTIADLVEDSQFDTILYIDVLEHIERDADELNRAAGRLAPGGVVIVLSPAFEILTSEFDRAVGHHRRYTRKSLAAAFPRTLRPRRLVYLDSVGFIASLANRLLLRQALPTARQIGVWDRAIIPASRVADGLLGRYFGRSVIAVFERP